MVHEQIQDFLRTSMSSNVYMLTLIKEKKMYLEENSQRFKTTEDVRPVAPSALVTLWNEIFPTMVDLQPQYLMIVTRYRILKSACQQQVLTPLQADVIDDIGMLIQLVRTIHFLLSTITNACFTSSVVKTIFLHSNALYLMVVDIVQKTELVQNRLETISHKMYQSADVGGAVGSVTKKRDDSFA